MTGVAGAQPEERHDADARAESFAHPDGRENPRGSALEDFPGEGVLLGDDHQHPGTTGHLPGRQENVRLVGQVTVTPRTDDPDPGEGEDDPDTGTPPPERDALTGRIADVGLWDTWAWLGAFREPTCEEGGVFTIDISDPTNPVELPDAFIPAQPDTYVGEGVLVLEIDSPTYTGPVLLHNNESCGEDGRGGISLWDVSDPTDPAALAENVSKVLFDEEDEPIDFEFSYHSVFAWNQPVDGVERSFMVGVNNEDIWDVDIFDITDPRAPVFLIDVGLPEWPEAQVTGFGESPMHHDVIVEELDEGWRMLVSYWDAGHIILDVDDPAEPEYLRQTVFDENEPFADELGIPEAAQPFQPEGNAHQARFSRDQEYFFATDENFNPFRLFGSIADVPDVEVRRLFGSERMRTAIEVSQAMFPEGSDTVVLARQDIYPDALAGGPLAFGLDAPILLTLTDSLHPAVAEEIRRLGATNVVMLGGTAALSQQVESDVIAQTSATAETTERVAGEHRFATAAAIAERVGGDRAYVAEGGHIREERGWPDALAISGLASYEQNAILLVLHDLLPDATAAALEDYDEAVIIGGSGAVSEQVEAQIDAIVDDVDRWAGRNRFETAVAIAGAAQEAGMNPASLWVATGNKFPDALVAGPAVARDGGVLILVDTTTLDNSPAARAYVQEHAHTVRLMTLLGGTAAISAQVEAQLLAAIKAARWGDDTTGTAFPAVNAAFTPTVTEQDPLEGPTRYIGWACEGDEVPEARGENEIALIQRGADPDRDPAARPCYFSDKVQNAMDAGYAGAIVFNTAGGCEGVFTMGGAPDLDEEITIPAVMVSHPVGRQMLGIHDPDDPCPEDVGEGQIGAAGAMVSVDTSVFQGWGYIHMHDTETMERIDVFAIDEALDEDYAENFGDLSVHKVAADPDEDLVYAAYYSGGLRVLAYDDTGMEEVGVYIHEDGNNFWGVEVHEVAGEKYIFASDRDSGLWIFEYTG